MNLLYLGSYNQTLFLFFERKHIYIRQYEKKIKNIHDDIFNDIDFVISFGYRYIIPENVISSFPNRIINLHISYLPWNRGSDPNLWSFLENTPKGTTIHHIEKGLDTGDIICQKLVNYSEEDTLKTFYDQLHIEMEQLLIKNWEMIIIGTANRKQQEFGGSYHRSKDKERYLHLLTEGWNTKVISLIGKGQEDI